MKIKALIFTCILIVIIFSGQIQAEELVDKIAAIIGNEIILVSELDFQLQMFAMQMQIQNMTEGRADSLRTIILEQLVSDKLILVEAQKDTTLQIGDEEIEAALNDKLTELRGRFPNEAEFEAQMNLEGLNLRELKSKFRREVRNQLIKERFIGRFLRKVTVTKTDVESFYERYADSLPTQPEAVKLTHFLLAIKPSGSTLDSAFLKAQKVKELLDQGGDFIALAQLYSEDASSESGGDLGFFDKGTLFEEFEDIVFQLNKDEISEPFKTRLGYHIVLIEDKLPNRMKARHILFRTNPSSDDLNVTYGLADSLKTEIENDNVEFTEVVKNYSADDDTKKIGGELGWFASDKLTPEFVEAIFGLDVGEISDPVESEFGIHVLKVLDRQSARPMNLTDDWDRIKDFTKRDKSDKVLTTFLDKVKQKVYVDVRL